jgi:hypothetical protein
MCSGVGKRAWSGLRLFHSTWHDAEGERSAKLRQRANMTILEDSNPVMM